MSRNSTGILLIRVGPGLIILGVLVSTGPLSWFGRLTADIRVERKPSRGYVPITSMVLLSVVLSLVLAIVR